MILAEPSHTLEYKCWGSGSATLSKVGQVDGARMATLNGFTAIKEKTTCQRLLSRLINKPLPL